MTTNSGPGLNPIESLSSDESYAFILTDPTASYWLKGALFRVWQRDPVDALNDAEILVSVLTKKCDELSERQGIPSG